MKKIFLTSIILFISISYSKSQWPPNIEVEIKSLIVVNENDNIPINILLTNNSQDTIIVKKLILNESYIKGIFIYNTEPAYLSSENMDLNKKYDDIDLSILDFDISLSEKTIENMLFSYNQPTYNFNLEILPKDTLQINLFATALYKGDYSSNLNIILEPKNFNHYKSLISNDDYLVNKLFAPQKLGDNMKMTSDFSLSKQIRTIVK